jgi:hypothetical protein
VRAGAAKEVIVSWLPSSFRSEYEHEVERLLEKPLHAPERIGEAHLARLPLPVQRYLFATGFVGRPVVESFELRFRGRIRSGPDSRWMPFDAEQVSRTDPLARLFFLRARYLGVPMQVLHRMNEGHAEMRVRALGALPVVDARGPVMDRSEAVTYLNDLCILAPGALVQRSLSWEEMDHRSARVRFASPAGTVSAVLYFDGTGLLRNFVSDDRSRAASDGKTFTPLRFSTPVSDYRDFGPYRLAAHGKARWHLPEGPFTYGEFELLEVTYNVHAPTVVQAA